MNQEIIELARKFRIGVISSGVYTPPSGLSNEEYLLAILKAESTAREERTAAERLRLARFPARKSFDEFDTGFQKGISQSEIDTLAKLEWVDAAFNLILIGPPGTGKTHIALAVGNEAVRNGYNVAFQTMDTLVYVLKTRDISSKSQSRLRYLKKCDIIIVDELGYLPISKVESNFFFALVSELFETTSFIITSNKGFDAWAEVFGDSVLTTALLDRLTHRCQVLSFSDESYRLAHRKNIFQ
jgi:DNA replication protein DnaC